MVCRRPSYSGSVIILGRSEQAVSAASVRTLRSISALDLATLCSSARASSKWGRAASVVTRDELEPTVASHSGRQPRVDELELVLALLLLEQALLLLLELDGGLVGLGSSVLLLDGRQVELSRFLLGARLQPER